jgi:cell division protease FtsH
MQVRRDSASIDLPILKEAMDKVRLGLPHTPLPDSAAKRRYAAVEAARAVAFALTPGLPPLEHVTIRPRGGAQARILFVPQEPRSDGGTWHLLAAEGAAVNAVRLDRPLTAYELCCALLTPLYVARCCEEELFGAEGVSLVTAREVARAGELARWIVVDSKLHPASRASPVLSNMRMGGGHDPTTAWMDTTHDAAVLALQRGAYKRAAALVRARRPVIERVAGELCDNADETVLGARVVELLQTTPLAGAPGEGQEGEAAAEAEAGGGAAVGAEVLGELMESEDARQLAELIMGRVSDWDLIPGSVARQKAAQVRAQLLDPAARARLEGVARYARAGGAFPAAPPVPQDQGPGLSNWLPPEDAREVINL